MGDVVPLFGLLNGGKQKKRDGRGLGHRLPPIKNVKHNNQPKTSGCNGGEYGGKVGQAGGAGEARYHPVGGVLELMEVKNLNKIVELGDVIWHSNEFS